MFVRECESKIICEAVFFLLYFNCRRIQDIDIFVVKYMTYAFQIHMISGFHKAKWMVVIFH